MGFLLAVPRALWRALVRASDQHAQRLAASIAFYAMFSLPALLMSAILVAGTVWGEDVARGRLVAQVGRYLGDGLATIVDSVIAGAVSSGATRPLPRVLAVGALFFGASLTFVELQHALNVIWGTDSKRRWYLAIAIKRLVSFAMVVVAGAVLMATMAASVGVARFGDWLADHLPRALALGVLRWLEPTASLGALTFLFALLYKVLPDGRVPWKRAWIGALVTSSLLLAARTLVARYVSVVDVASVYGAAGSLAVLLVWVYASCVVILLGGTFAFAWEEVRSGRASVPPSGEPPPSEGAGPGAPVTPTSATDATSGPVPASSAVAPGPAPLHRADDPSP